MEPVDPCEELDKDSGPELPAHFPAALASRIEQLLGGAEQFDSADFDAVAYINKAFPTEQSLAGAESAAARCEFRLAGVEADMRRLVRAQAAQRRAGQAALGAAQRSMAALALQVSAVSARAARSEGAVREITAEIKQLDCAKTHLTAAITALNHLHMLAGGVAALRDLTARRRYRDAVLPLQALEEVLRHFRDYRDIRELSALRDELHSARRDLAHQILADFRAALGAERAAPAAAVSPRTLAEACAAADALEPRVRRDLLQWFVALQLQEYVHLFSREQECAWLTHVDQRYGWLKKHLLAFEEALAHVFPAHWRVSERIARRFCEMTREELGALLEARRAELDVKLLLLAIQKTYNFELLLHKRFVGTEPSAEPAPAQAAEGAAAAEGADAEEGAGPPWLGLIGGCFEPYLSLYIQSLDASLRALMDRFVQEARAADAAGAAPDTAGAGSVISSCADLFLFYKKCLVQCARLTTGEPMLELAGVFQKYLREYASNVLQASLPRGAGAGAAAGGLVSGLHTLLRDDAAAHARYSPHELARVTSVITTAEYCLETTAHLEQKLREKVSGALAARVDLAAEQRLFHALIDASIALLVRELQAACAPALVALARGPWAHVEAVGDRSAYVAQLTGTLGAALPALRERLAGARKYYTQLCTRLASALIPEYLQALYRVRPSPAGAEQLLLDAHTLKTALLELPGAGAVVPRAPPAVYAKVVVKLMSKAEMALKLVLAPGPSAAGAGADGGAQFAAQCVQLLPECSLAEFHKLLEMRGARLGKAQLAALDKHFRDAARARAAAD